MYTLYYRSHIRFCYYKCEYCPFSRVFINILDLRKDRENFEKFIDKVENYKEELNIFFAPRGEILSHNYYRDGIIKLLNFKHVKEVVVQTNLSWNVDWMNEKNNNFKKLIIWGSYHPTQVELNQFGERIEHLLKKKIKFTVGSVGVKENLKKINELKTLLVELSEKYDVDVPYLWVNAYKDENNYYEKSDIEFLSKIDPYFEINFKNHKSKNLKCDAGKKSFVVESNGDIMKCWKSRKKIGNIHLNDLKEISNKDNGLCKYKQCTCFIGYSNLESLNLNEIYKQSVLGRLV